MFNRLSVQTGVVFFVGMALVVGGLSWILYSRESEALPEKAAAEAAEAAFLVSSSIADDVHYRRAFQIWKNLNGLLKSVTHEGFSIKEYAVVDASGMVLTHSDPKAHPVMTPMQTGEDGTVWSGDTLKVTQTIVHPSDGRTLGHLMLSFDVSSIQDKLALLQREIIYAFLIASLVSVLLAFGISVRVSAPLRQLASTATRIGSGGIKTEAYAYAPKEVALLASSMQKADQTIVSDQLEIKKSNDLLQSILDHTPAVIFIKDRDGKYLLINQRFEQLFHISNDNIQGKTDLEIFDDGVAATLQGYDRQVIDGAEELLIEENIPDDRGLRRYLSLMFPLFDEENQVKAVCGLATDITEEKERSLQLAKLGAVVEQADELIVITDSTGVIEYVNPAFERISGYSADETIGNKPSLVKSGEHSDIYYTAMWETLASGKTWRGDFINKARDGGLYEVTQSITPIKRNDDEIIGYVAVQHNVTEQRQIQKKLQHTDRVESLGILAGGIAHDFNNLLTAILGNASLAIKHFGSDATASRYLSAIEQASMSAADLCRQMLAYSGKGKFIVKPVNLSGLVENMGKLIDVSLAKNIVVKYHLSEQTPCIDGDVAQMQQVILNLITNASEAIEGKSGVISLATGMMQVGSDYLNGCLGDHRLEPGRYVFLEVSDNGCGMDAETQKKIFDPFFTTKFTGRGLGMSAMLGIVKGHHGGLRIYSEPGQGTTIKIVFPLSHEQADRNESPELSDNTWKASGMALVVDDEETVREVAALMLGDFGLQVITACDGLEGVERFREHQHEISVVLMDMTMPKMDGQSCFRALREINPDVRVILSSGYNEQEATSRFAGKGLAGFVQKPYSANQLAETLQSVLGDA